MAASAVAVGAGALLAPSASAADQWGQGFLIPDSAGHAGASHIGDYRSAVPGAIAYCADPGLAGPQAAGGYGTARDFTSWTSQATGKAATAAQVSQAAYIVSKYGQAGSDAQAAAVDADVYTLLNAGSTYALPAGTRAVQRLSYPQVDSQAKTLATAYLNEAARFAGPYTVHLQPLAALRPGVTTGIKITVTSAAGNAVPGIRLNLKAALDGKQVAEDTESTNADGIAYAHVTAAKGHSVTLTTQATGLPGTTLRAVLPHNKGAQRMVLAGGTTSATAQLTMTATGEGGRIKVAKTAGDTGKPLAGVKFAARNKDGKTVATGTTNADGIWQTAELPAGEYTVHEVQAVDGYQLAADQQVTVKDGKATAVAVQDTRIPKPTVPKPRPVTIKVLPKTGA
ncbi:MSCRAMM family protein [Streptomyces silvisoli]|uniref:Prealbumin-like fold domain-containing protein n=1 Tax=Streptomyces silvisoli TaxID=3034235 RepID=A0ABT5ZKQ5_9ACTN|nr:prealbumin-like fold domain-containing protein [Streptomyces silvisoli]MDF3290170.1 prealbumin-like fold domain-containing protein [Streptomyces silvisoli]